MKLSFVGAALICGLLTSNVNAAPRRDNRLAKQPQALHFARGATQLSVTLSLSGSQHRYYTLRMRAGQHLKISARSDAKTGSQLVPLIFVTPPCGQFNGDKTATYAEDSSRAGDYKIAIAPNMMASKRSSGKVVLNVEAI